MRKAIVTDGIVTNIVDAPDDWLAPSGQTYPVPDGVLCDIRWACDSGVFTSNAAAPDAAQLLSDAQEMQKSSVTSAYKKLKYADISFTTAAGVAADFQADESSRTAIKSAIAVYVDGGIALPDGYYWQAADNSQPAFTAADLSGLLAAIVARDWVDFQKLQALKTEIAAATTIEAVQENTWSE